MNFEQEKANPSERPSCYHLAKADLIETEPGGYEIGRDPRDVPRDILAKYYPPLPGGAGNGKVVRAKCMDCCCELASEVRKCTALKCALWPYRMGTNPFTRRSGRGFKKPLVNGGFSAKPGAAATTLPGEETGPVCLS
jgi:hypothetical protein